MIVGFDWRLIDRRIANWTFLVLGVVVLVVSPLIGAIPGPGGLIVAGIGLALMLKGSITAKRRYVQFKRSQPKVGRWADKALRRRSSKRREERRKVLLTSVGN